MEMKDSKGCTALHHAAHVSNLTAIQLFKEHSEERGEELEVNAENDDGFTPLDEIFFNRSEQLPDLPFMNTADEKAIQSYGLLRQMGALSSPEKRGILVG